MTEIEESRNMQKYLRDIRLPLRCQIDLRSFGVLRNADW